MRKKFTIFLVLFLWLLLFTLSANKTNAATYSYTLSNIQYADCSMGEAYTPLNLRDFGDIIQVFGDNLGNRTVDDYINEQIYIESNRKWMIYRGSRSDADGSTYYGPISWTNNQITFEAQSGDLIGPLIILKTYSSSADNRGSCVRGILTPGVIVCDSWAYSDWGICSFSGQQTRTVSSSLPSGCAGGSPILTQTCTPTCTANNYSCDNWSACSVNNSQSRTCTKISNCEGGTPMPAISQSCTYTPPVCNSWTYSNWGACSSGGQQTRTIISSSPSSCAGGSPTLTQSCTPTLLTCTSWTYTIWSSCSSGGTQTRNITSSSPDGCSGGNPILTQSCSYTVSVPTITSISPDIIYSGTEITINGNNFGQYEANCYTLCYPKNRVKINNVNLINSSDDLPKKNWTDTRAIVKLPSDARSGYITVADKDGNESNKYNFTITPKPIPCTELLYSLWSECGSDGKQTRKVVYKYPANCEGGELPKLTQSCSYTPVAPTCSADTWQCGNWGTCSPQGIQTRSCTRTYDCPSAETAAPATSQYCEAPNQPKLQSPTEDLGIVNQDSIIKSTVKLICPVSNTMASQGSGTVIDSKGTILTNKHVIDGTAGCWVGFIDNYDDEPYFGDRQIADIYKVSSDADVAVLKLRNPSNKTLTSINISQSNSGSIKLGEILTTYGYPAKFGTKITYTSGDFSGVDGNYLKTTAIIEHGNSGGGAYLKNGAFIGIPTAVVKGSLNSMGYLLSVNKVNSWLNNSIAYNYNSNNNNYSRVSAMLEDMDLSALGSLGLFVAGDEANIKTATESQTVIAEEKRLATKVDNSLSKRMNGNILLQVEKNGEGWYVYPDDKKKYYLGRPADAFNIMRNLGLGIKHGELANYLNMKFPSRLSGKIMLDVEQNGEAYYINPKDLKGYFLNRPADAFKVMRDLGLGITNTDIRKIGVGEIK